MEEIIDLSDEWQPDPRHAHDVMRIVNDQSKIGAFYQEIPQAIKEQQNALWGHGPKCAKMSFIMYLIDELEAELEKTDVPEKPSLKRAASPSSVMSAPF